MSKAHEYLDYIEVSDLASIANFTDARLDGDGDTDSARYAITEEVLESVPDLEIDLEPGALTIESPGGDEVELTFAGLRLALGRSNKSATPQYYGMLIDTDGDDEVPRTQRSVRYQFKKTHEISDLLSATAADQRQQKQSESITDPYTLAHVVSEIAQLIEVAELAIDASEN